MQMSAIEFQTKCLEVIGQIIEKNEDFFITENGKPVIKCMALKEDTPRSFGYMKGSVQFHGDILAPFDETWEAESWGVLPYVNAPHTS